MYVCIYIYIYIHTHAAQGLGRPARGRVVLAVGDGGAHAEDIYYMCCYIKWYICVVKLNGYIKLYVLL